jgi:hypothetical protein
MRLFLSVLTLALGYTNVAILASVTDERLATGMRLPLASAPAAFLNVFPVFQYFLRYNMEFELEGRRADAATWVRLDLAEYFPFRRGELHARLLTDALYAYGGEAARQRAWDFMARKLQARHNRLHPDAPVDAIRLRQLRWPRSIEGYRAQRTPSMTREILIYVGPRRNERSAS